MSFAISGNTITQSGTDSNWSDLATLFASIAAAARSTAYSVGNVRKPAVANGWWYRCTTAGTTAATEPTWGQTQGGTTTDGTCVWTADITPIVTHVHRYAHMTRTLVPLGGGV